jgi:hypothetical protein
VGTPNHTGGGGGGGQAKSQSPVMFGLEKIKKKSLRPGMTGWVFCLTIRKRGTNWVFSFLLNFPVTIGAKDRCKNKVLERRELI